MITKKDIYRSLSELGIKHSDKLTVHVSLRSAGKIENGADGKARPARTPERRRLCHHHKGSRRKYAVFAAISHTLYGGGKHLRIRILPELQGGF